MISIEKNLDDLIEVAEDVFDKRYQPRGTIPFYRGLIEWSARTPLTRGYCLRYGRDTSIRSTIHRAGLPHVKRFSDAVRVSLFFGLRGAGHRMIHITYAMGWSSPGAMCRRFKALELDTPSKIRGGMVEWWSRFLSESFDPVAETAMRLSLINLWRAA